VLVTPGQARRWLEESAENGDREIKRKLQWKVDLLADRIKSGEWTEKDPQKQHHKVRLRVRGGTASIVQGHHRLHAIAQAGIPADLEIEFY